MAGIARMRESGAIERRRERSRNSIFLHDLKVEDCPLDATRSNLELQRNGQKDIELATELLYDDPKWQ